MIGNHFCFFLLIQKLGNPFRGLYIVPWSSPAAVWSWGLCCCLYTTTACPCSQGAWEPVILLVGFKIVVVVFIIAFSFIFNYLKLYFIMLCTVLNQGNMAINLDTLVRTHQKYGKKYFFPYCVYLPMRKYLYSLSCEEWMHESSIGSCTILCLCCKHARLNAETNTGHEKISHEIATLECKCWSPEREAQSSVCVIAGASLRDMFWKSSSCINFSQMNRANEFG